MIFAVQLTFRLLFVSSFVTLQLEDVEAKPRRHTNSHQRKKVESHLLLVDHDQLERPQTTRSAYPLSIATNEADEEDRLEKDLEEARSAAAATFSQAAQYQEELVVTLRRRGDGK